MSEAEVARAVAYFEACDDLPLLRDLLREIQPRAAAAVRSIQQQRGRIPPPLDVEAAPEAATQDEALRVARGVSDFAQLQAIARTIGRRVEQLSP